MRTRTAAKHASSFPFVPVRQVVSCHLASANMSSAGIDRISVISADADGRAGDWPDHRHVDRVHLEMARDAKCANPSHAP